MKFKVPERPRRLDPFADKLSGWLEMESGKGRKVRRTARRLHADLVTLGYDGSDPAPTMPSFISRIRSPYAPGWGGLQRLLG